LLYPVELWVLLGKDVRFSAGNGKKLKGRFIREWEGVLNFSEGRDDKRLFFELSLIRREFVLGENRLSQMVAGPGLQGADFCPRSGHAGGEVLEMTDGVADEKGVVWVLEEPF
jgi:hypothetical protein